MARRVEVERLKPVRRRLEVHRQPIPQDDAAAKEARAALHLQEGCFSD
jgi:hypothetical protein